MIEPTAQDGLESPARREFLGACARGALVVGAGLVLGEQARAQEPAPAPAPATPEPARYAARDFSALGGLRGISDGQLATHLELYQGYVRRTNALLEGLHARRLAGTVDAEGNELRRRLGFEWNGMRLHELYFENLARDAAPLAADHPLALAAVAGQGSLEAWRADLLATAKAPGVGWVIVSHDVASGQLLTGWVDDHDGGHLAGGRPVLVIDVWEHAFSVDRKPTERAAYLEAVLSNVSWPVVASRMGA